MSPSYSPVNRVLPIVSVLFLLGFCNSLSAQVTAERNIKPVATAVVNFHQRAIEDLLRPPVPVVRKLKPPNQAEEKYKEPYSQLVMPPDDFPIANRVAVVSPAPVLNYESAPDGAQFGSGSWTIPPDTYGAVGLDKVFTNLNNNYRILNKTTGAQLSIVSIETFWDPLGADGNNVFDPRVVYDPYNNRWIVAAVSNGSNAASRVLLGISQTHDPQGNYNLYSFDPDIGSTLWADYPMVGFNKNWIAIGINMFTIPGAGSTNKFWVIDYPALRGGTVTSTVFTGTAFCSHPVETFSSTENVLYVPNHQSSAGGTYRLNTITGTPAVPVYTVGGLMSRTGGGWVQQGGNLGPQNCTSSCPGTLVGLDVGDAQIRTNAVFRNNAIWYPQAIGLPTGGPITRVAVQWTKLNTDGTMADGGRVDDPTATSSNGGRWYTYPSITVNSNNDALLGFSKFESDGYAGAAYSMRLSTDAAGTIQDPVIYQDGLDYYEKDFGSGRNRWGDYSHTMVDPLDDASFWTIQEYAKLRANPIVGGSNSKWGTWWAKVAPNACLSNVASGNWSVAGTWGCVGVPTSTSHVNIMSGHNVTLNVDPSAATITVNEGGTLTINTTRTLSCKLIVYGTLNIAGGQLTLGANDVFLSENATVTGATSTSYFITNGTGTVSKIIPGGGSFQFPLSSNGTSYNSLTVALNAGDPAEVFSLRVSTGVTPSSSSNNSCVQRTWNINEMTSGGNNATLTFKWSAGEHGSSYNPAVAAYAYRYNGSTYVLANNMTVPSLAAGIYTSSTVGTANTFSPWIVTSTATLPVTIDFFTGTKQNNDHLLNWKSTCTGNTATFDLQRSADGINFNTFYSITGDYLRCLQPFDHTDISPLAGKNFYRLKVKDEVGKIIYSRTILLLNAATGFEIVGLQPTIVSNSAILNVSVANKQQLSIFVADSKGSRLMERGVEATAGSNLVEMNFAGLPSGTYFLSVVSSMNEQKTIRFIKQ